MKKIIAFVIVMMLVLSITALADEKLKVTDKNMIVFPGDDSGYFYAKVENDTGVPVGVSTGDLVVFTTDDDILLSESYVASMPSYVVLEPGDYLYVREFIWDDALIDAEIGDYKFSMPISSSSTEIAKLPCEATLDLKGVGTYDNYVSVTLNNDSDIQIVGPYIVAAVYDQNGNIIFADAYSLSGVTVNQHSSITVKLSVDNDLMEYYANNDIIPTTIDAYTCYEK